jgi:hypothetical protein
LPRQEEDMAIYSPIQGYPPDYSALMALAALLNVRSFGPSLETSEFVCLGRLAQANGSSLFAYRSLRTGGFLTLDRGGHAYRFVAACLTNGEWTIHYEAFHGVDEALRATTLPATSAASSRETSQLSEEGA